MILQYILLSIIFCCSPIIILWLCNKFSILSKVGPVLLLYFMGIIIGNSGLCKNAHDFQEVLSSAMIPLAIPLMLFGSSFKKSETKTQILSMLSGIISLVIILVISYLFIGKYIEDGDKIGAMLIGTYTGGTINMASLKTMLGVKENIFILANSYDMLICFTYLIFLISIGIKLFRKILPVKNLNTSKEDLKQIEVEIEKNKENPYKGIFSKNSIKSIGLSLGLTLVIILISALVAFGISRFAPSAFIVIFILSLTSLGIAFSFHKKVRKQKHSYDIGMYFIYIFSITVASMANLRSLNFSENIYLFLFMCSVVFGSLILHTLFAKILKIDADTMVITSVTFINSPPFVPMIVGVMKNKNVLAAGLSIGIIGYAIGNYLGYLIFLLLKVL